MGKHQEVTRKFAALMELDPEAAARKMVDIFRNHFCDIHASAAELGCTQNAWYRWMRRLGNREALDAVRAEMAKLGLYAPDKGGRPKGSLGKKKTAPKRAPAKKPAPSKKTPTKSKK